MQAVAYANSAENAPNSSPAGNAIKSIKFSPQRGIASYYVSGKTTSNGEPFDTRRMTAAHRSLPFGTLVKVTNLDNNKATVVRINDRGPFIGGRVIDLSRAAAAKIGMIASGTAHVLVEVASKL